MVGYTRELKKILSSAGCELFRHGKGDHEIWRTPDGKHFTVDGDIRSKHTANKTLQDAGLKKKF